MKKEKLSEIIYNARTKKGISQRELARKTGVDNAEISRIEKGIRLRPGIVYLRKLALELELDLKKLMEMSEYTKEDIDFFAADGLKIIDQIYSESFQYYQDYSRDVGDGYRALDFLKLIRGYKQNHISEQNFISLLSYGLGVDIKKYIFKD